MGVKMDNDNNAPKYTFHRKAGRSIIERRPVFSPDGESLLIIVENLVRVYNIQTGDCARILETEAPVNELVGVQFPENEEYNLYGCSDDGCVTTWTWENGAVLRDTKLQIPNNLKVLTINLVDNNECFITAGGPNRKNIYYALYSVKTGELLYEFRDSRAAYFENMTSVAIGWCNGERFAAIANGSPRLFIQNLHQPHVKEEFVNTNKIRIMSVTAHHTENAVAITDTLGRATILRGDFFKFGSLGREVLHWHFLPATAVGFSLQGSYLYTGGMEKVLVKWTVGNLANKANEKMFVPRLPGIIKYVATNNAYVAATLSNNSVVIANAQMRVVSTILECGGLSPVARAFGTPLAYHQRLGGLLMAGRTGHLQLYSTTTDKVLYNIDITGINDTPPERHNLLPIETEVTCHAVSGNGSWLVTSEYRNDGVTYPEERLKFWLLEIKSATPFKLNTCVNLSHGGCKIVSIALSSKGEFCVTAGADQKFRIWKRENTSQKHRKKMSWNCLTACYYSSGIAQFLSHGILNNCKNGKMPPGKGEEFPYLREFTSKNDIVKKLVNIHKEHNFVDENIVNAGMRRDDDNDMGGVAISHDGSLIAAWFGCKLTLWDTHLCNLRTTLSHPGLRPKGIDVQFGNQDAAHYLVCTTESCVAVWSLLSLTVKWMVQINPTCLAAHPLHNKMAVVTTNNDGLFIQMAASEHSAALDSFEVIFKYLLPKCQTPDTWAKCIEQDSSQYVNKPATLENLNLHPPIFSNVAVHVFTPHSSTPVLTKKRLLDPKTGVFKQCAFGASSASENDIRLYVVRNDSEVYCLEPEQSEEGRLEVMSRRNLAASNFSALLAEQRLSEVRPAQGGAGAVQQTNDALGNTAVAQFLSAAPHMVPPVSLLCTSFLQHISGQEQSESPSDPQEETAAVDESSSDEEDSREITLNGPYAPKITQLWTPNYEKVKEKRLQKIVKEPLLDLHATESIFCV